MMALIMTMKNNPQAVMMSFQRKYAEYGVIVTNQYWPYGFNSSRNGSIGRGFFVQNAIRSTTSGEFKYASISIKLILAAER